MPHVDKKRSHLVKDGFFFYKVFNSGLLIEAFVVGDVEDRRTITVRFLGDCY